LAEAAATVAPRGKQNSFAAHGRAHYVLAERGNRQPRTLAGAFAKPVDDKDLMAKSIEELERFRSQLDDAYGPAAENYVAMQVGKSGKLADIIAFCRG
jgi:CRISPR system Cascade subunit CasC